MTSKRKIILPGTVTSKFFGFMLLSALAGVGMFILMWFHKENVYIFLLEHNLIRHDREQMIEEFIDKAVDVTIEPVESGGPGGQSDTDGVYYIDVVYYTDEIYELMELRDYYSGIIIYDEAEERYITAYYPKVMEDWAFSMSATVRNMRKIDDHTTIKRQVQFKDINTTVYFFSYQLYGFLPWYLMASIIIALIIFLVPLLLYLRYKMNKIKQLKTEILYIAEGNLEREIDASGTDEIGILASQMDDLRKTLEQNIRSEQISRQANRDLISAISHDLRTPLTILSGYLEILKRNRGSQEQQEEYLERCLHKAEEIRDLSDKMFEYALVYEEDEELTMEQLPVSAIQEELVEHIHYAELMGYQVDAEVEPSSSSIRGNSSALKRVLNNLFSNILKYGDKRKAVTVECRMEAGRLYLVLRNYVKEQYERTESNQIGLKSVAKIIWLHQGECCHTEQNQMFSIEIKI